MTSKHDKAFEGIDVGIAHEGNAIVLPALPAPMGLQLAAATLLRKHEEAEQVVNFSESVDAYPKDGAVAFHRAMAEMFGWVNAVPTPGMFGPRPPQTLDVEIGFNERISVVWGRFEIAGIEGHVNCGYEGTDKGPRFAIGGTVKRKDFPVVQRLAELTRKLAAEQSIYRGKAVTLTVDEDGDMDWNTGFGFMDLSRVNPDELVFSTDTELQIQTSLWTPIERTALCRQHKIPLKRGILLEGKYGCGKTLTSAVTAVKAVENGWTFLTINRVAGLKEAIQFARKYQPCVIFAEDIDRVIEGEDRTEDIDDILNEIDGIGSKGTEIMVVLTTNHIEKMNRAMLRPGRLDAVVSVTPPDAEAARKLIRLYGRSMLRANDSLTGAGEALAGSIPAMIRECVERAKLFAIHRSAGGTLVVEDADIVDAAQGLRAHMDLLEAPVEEKREPSLKDMVADAVQDSVRRLVDYDQTIISDVRDVERHTIQTRRDVMQLVEGMQRMQANGARPPAETGDGAMARYAAMFRPR